MGAPPPGHTCSSVHAILNHENKERKKLAAQSSITCVLIGSLGPPQRYSGTLDRFVCELGHTYTHTFMHSAYKHTYTNAPQSCFRKESGSENEHEKEGV